MKIMFYAYFVYTISLLQGVTAIHCNTLTSKCSVLMIFLDDMRYLSDEINQIPNIKKLVAKSIYFENAFAQQSLCAPSRNSILTGRRPDTLRLYDFYNYWRETIGNFTTLPQLLKDHGYETYSVGKVFHPGKSSNFSDDYPYSWTHYPYHPSTEKYKNAAVCKDEKSNILQRNLICPVNVGDQPEHTLPDIQSLRYAIKFLLNENRKKPWFLAVGFHKPHIPLKFPAKYLDKYPISIIELPEVPYRPSEMPIVAWHPWEDVRNRNDIRRLHISFPFGTMPLEWTKKIKQSYFAASSYIDDLMGDLISHVNMSNTIIVLTSDHGWSLGENGLWAKYSNFDVALKVPLMFVIPGFQARTVYTPVELIDIFPTIADLTGVLKTKTKCKKRRLRLCFDGKSLLPYIMGKDRMNRHSRKNIAISQYPRPSVHPQENSDKPKLKNIKIMGYSIRTQRFRYTEWIDFNSNDFKRNWTHIYGAELYDHYIDKDEAINVYSIPLYMDLRRKLSKQLQSEVESF